MTGTRPTLYLSRLIPDPVMAIVLERFQLVQGSRGLPWEFVGDRAACFGYTDS